MEKKRWAFRVSALTSLVLFFAVLFILNLFASRRFHRLDLTEGRVYTLSRSSKETLRKLDDLLRIEAYFSEKLPPNLLTLRDMVSDLLEEYEAYSGGNVQAKFVDPAKNSETQTRVVRMGVPQIQMNIFEKDKVQLVQGFLGMGLFYEDRQEVIPFVQSTTDLEYEVTARILKLIRKEEPTVGILLGEGHTLEEDYQFAQRELEKEYRVLAVDRERPDLSQADILIVASFAGLSEPAFYAIDQYLMRGGKALFLADAVSMGEGLSAQFIDSSQFSLLEHYGVKVEKTLVLDRSNEMASFSSGYMNFFLPYPFFVKVRKGGFSKDHPLTKNLESLVLPWTSSLELRENEGIVNMVLAQSTNQSWVQAGFLNLNPQQIAVPDPADLKPRPLAVSLRGSLESFYKGRPVPEGMDGSIVEKSPETEIVVVGNSQFATSGFLQQFPENQVFFLNTVDWLGFGEELIHIRSRGATDRPLKTLSEGQKALFKFFNLYGISLLLISFGLFRYAVRQREKKKEISG